MNYISQILQLSTESPHHYTASPPQYRFPSAVVVELGLKVA